VTPPGQFDRLSALLTFTAASGQQCQVEMTLDDVKRVVSDLVELLAADADRACG
jgi:hypothetical protein